ncbi:hypothetical protein DICA3_E14730 [Diutina catenulata]
MNSSQNLNGGEPASVPLRESVNVRPLVVRNFDEMPVRGASFANLPDFEESSNATRVTTTVEAWDAMAAEAGLNELDRKAFSSLVLEMSIGLWNLSGDGFTNLHFYFDGNAYAYFEEGDWRLIVKLDRVFLMSNNTGLVVAHMGRTVNCIYDLDQQSYQEETPTEVIATMARLFRGF